MQVVGLKRFQSVSAYGKKQVPLFSGCHLFVGDVASTSRQLRALNRSKPLVLHCQADSVDLAGLVGLVGPAEPHMVAAIDGPDVLAFVLQTYGVKLHPDLVNKHLPKGTTGGLPPDEIQKLRDFRRAVEANMQRYGNALFAYVGAGD
ncbi:MAG: hypothetical protein KC476_08895 [Cyanobacteria bacterium HKST-UBA06]|nr:hypothetical protein [Cyanobacteria bacterium HKST-UBA05]MCA9808059.1 hypothetical protein [Cyanobacteria bacterium HKST-UBA06]